MHIFSEPEVKAALQFFADKIENGCRPPTKGEVDAFFAHSGISGVFWRTVKDKVWGPMASRHREKLKKKLGKAAFSEYIAKRKRRS